METHLVKHNSEFFFAAGLPDAPLAMPKQQLERRNRSLMGALRHAMAGFPGMKRLDFLQF